MRKKRSRRVRGTGSIFKYKDRWIYRKDGVQRSAATISELQKKIDAITPPGPDMTVKQWCSRWLESLTVRPATKDGYTNSIEKYVGPTLGHLVLGSLTTHQIEAASREWAKALHPNTVRLTFAHLRIACNAAVRAGLIHTNPVTVAKKPRGEKKKVQLFTPSELSSIIGLATNRPCARALSLLAATGCRIGEAVALDVSDFDGTSIKITKTQSERHGAGPPKSANSVRTIRVPESALPALRLSTGQRKMGPLFLTEGKRRMTRVLLREALLRVLAEAKMSNENRSVHVMRHSVASALIGANMPIADVARYLGDSPGTIVANYLHAVGVDAASGMERLLTDKVTQK